MKGSRIRFMKGRSCIIEGKKKCGYCSRRSSKMKEQILQVTRYIPDGCSINEWEIKNLLKSAKRSAGSAGN